MNRKFSAHHYLGNKYSIIKIAMLTALTTLSIVALAPSARGEYGDVVLNNTSKGAGMNPVIFPHWVHRMKYSCRACHEALGFKMRVGASGITMQKIFQGEYCAKCHDGKVAFATTQCQLCHSGRKALPTQVHRSTQQSLVAPLE